MKKIFTLFFALAMLLTSNLSLWAYDYEYAFNYDTDYATGGCIWVNNTGSYGIMNIFMMKNYVNTNAAGYPAIRVDILDDEYNDYYMAVEGDYTTLTNSISSGKLNKIISSASADNNTYFSAFWDASGTKHSFSNVTVSVRENEDRPFYAVYGTCTDGKTFYATIGIVPGDANATYENLSGKSFSANNITTTKNASTITLKATVSGSGRAGGYNYTDQEYIQLAFRGMTTSYIPTNSNYSINPSNTLGSIYPNFDSTDDASESIIMQDLKNYSGYDFWNYYMLIHGTVQVLNPNCTNKPMYVYLKNIQNTPNGTYNITIGSIPSLRSLTVSTAGTGANGSASISCAENHGYPSGGFTAGSSGNYYYDGTTVTLVAPSANTGYHFVNWTKGGTSKSNNASYSLGNVSSTNSGAYVANFAANTYNVVFNNNGGSGTMSNQSHTYGSSKALTANAFTAPAGKRFKGWATTQANANNGTVAYADKASVTNLTTTNNGNFNLYAVWEDDVYTITYKDKDNADYSGSNEASLPATHTYNTPTNLVAGVKDGYTFGGWYTDAECTVSAGSTIGATDKTADFTLYAKWIINNHTVTITTPENGTLTVKNGETTINNNDEVEDGATLTLTATPDAGYKFGEWTGNAAASVTVDDDVTLGVSFTQKSYTVAVSVAGTDANATVTRGDGGTSSTVKRYGNTILLTPNASTGYHFTGWTGTDANAAELVDNNNDTWTLTIADKSENYQYELTANFAINTYTVTWKNGETVLETDENVSYGATPTYNGDEPTKAADAQYTYAFTGWTPDVVAVTDDAVYSATFSSTPKSYTLTWITDGDELTGDYTTGTVAYGTTIEAPATPTKTGYDFAGWSPAVAETMPAANTTYTATWTFDAFDLLDDKTNGDEYYTTLSEKVGQTLNVRYKRSFTAGTWAVFSLPFGYSYRNDENRTFRGQVYTLVSAKYTSDGFLTLNCMPASTGIVANKPHILIPDVDIENPVFMNVKMKGIAPSYYTVQNTEGIGSGVEFRNTTERETLAKDKRVIYVKDNTLYYPNMTVDSWMRPFRGYFYLKIAEDEIQYYSPARVRLVNEEGETIETLPEASEETSAEVKKYIENGILVIERTGVKYDAQGHKLN